MGGIMTFLLWFFGLWFFLGFGWAFALSFLPFFILLFFAILSDK